MDIKLILKLEKVLLKQTKHYWIVIGLVLIILAGMETAEFSFGISDTFHLSEIIIYVVLFSVVGFLVEMVLRANRAQQRTMDVLKYKHKFSLDLIPYQNWDSLVALLTKRLAEIVDVREAYLSIRDPLTDEFEIISDWMDGDHPRSLPKISCQACVDKNTSNRVEACYCEFTTDQLALADLRSEYNKI